VREESRKVSVTTEARFSVELPGMPYDLWVRGELDDHLHLPDRYFTVEIIGGEIIVSPAPALEHGGIISDIVEVVVKADLMDPTASWRCLQGAGMDLVGIQDGYVPDILLLDTEVYAAARKAKVRYLVPDQIELVIEVISPSSADHDRAPTHKRAKSTKWNGYARAEIPYYLLVDRDPKVARTTLFSIPDQSTGAYLHHESWAFGETVRLPEPFGLGVPTDGWQPW
jgi:Uma2 family endonuclease